MGDILFIAHRLPYPPDRGDRLRSYHLLKALAKLGRVHLAAFVDDARDLAHVDALRPFVGRIHVEVRRRSLPVAALAALATRRPVSLAAFDSGGMRAAVDTMLAEEPIDTVFAFSGQMAQFVPERGGLRFIMDFVDVDSAKFDDYADRADFPLRIMHRREARLLAAFERKIAARADRALFVSEAEAALFRERGGAGNVAVLENGADLDFFRPGAVAPQPQNGPLILFTGQMDYPPNIEAVQSFVSSSFATIRKERPDARFAIVGRNPTRDVTRLASAEGVLVTGEVADVRPWLAAADIVVAPLSIARGVQNKLLEAMAMGRPVIASPAAFAGIEAEAGRDLIVARIGEEAAPLLALLGDPARAALIGRNARARMEARYGWDARLAPLAAMVGRA